MRASFFQDEENDTPRFRYSAQEEHYGLALHWHPVLAPKIYLPLTRGRALNSPSVVSLFVPGLFRWRAFVFAPKQLNSSNISHPQPKVQRPPYPPKTRPSTLKMTALRFGVWRYVTTGASFDHQLASAILGHPTASEPVAKQELTLLSYISTDSVICSGWPCTRDGQRW